MIIFSLSATKLLKRLIASGAHLRLAGNDLQIKMNGQPNPRLRQEIERNKDGLTQLVRAGEHRWREVNPK